MLICTFFGHSDTPKEIEPTLMSTLIDLIENKNVLKFYIGKHKRSLLSDCVYNCFICGLNCV